MKLKQSSLRVLTCIFLLFISLSLNSTATGSRDETLALAKEVVELAKQGKVLGCEFPVGTNISDVLAKWGRVPIPEAKFYFLKNPDNLGGSSWGIDVNEDNKVSSIVCCHYPGTDQIREEDYEELLGKKDKDMDRYDVGGYWLEAFPYCIKVYSKNID